MKRQIENRGAPNFETILMCFERPVDQHVTGANPMPAKISCLRITAGQYKRRIAMAVTMAVQSLGRAVPADRAGQVGALRHGQRRSGGVASAANRATASSRLITF